MSILFPDLAKIAVQKSYYAYKEKEQQQRIQRIEELVDWYNGDSKVITDAVQSYFSVDEDDLPFSYTNILRHIIDRVSLVYKDPPIRRFGEEPDEAYDVITQRKNVRMKHIERNIHLLGDVLVRIYTDEDRLTGDRRLRYEIIRSFIPFFDQVGTLKAVMYPLGFAEGPNGEQVWEYWDEEDHKVVDNDFVTVDNQEEFGIDDGINRYGALPFAFLHKSELMEDAFSPMADDLFNANLIINIALTNLNFAVQYNSFKQAYITGEREPNSDKSQKFGPQFVVEAFGENISAGVLDISTNLQQIVDAIKYQVQAVERNWHLAGRWSIEGQAPSGYSLMIQNLELLDFWQDQVDVAREWEKDLLIAEKLVWETDVENTLVNNIEDFTVDFKEVEFPLSPEEQRAQQEFELDHNIISILDIKQEQTPDTDRDILKDQIEDNIRLNKEFRMQRTATLAELAGQSVTRDTNA